jgi:hypothetical protein
MVEKVAKTSPAVARRSEPGGHRGRRRRGSIRAMGEITVTAELEPHGPAAAVVLDDEQVAAIGEGSKRFPVVVTINAYTWRTTVSRMGGEFLVGMSKANREGANVQAGDTVTMHVALDTQPREVAVPPALAAALDADVEAKAKFDALAFTHRKEFARWIEEAKREETRERRVGQALEMLHQGKTRS